MPVAKKYAGLIAEKYERSWARAQNQGGKGVRVHAAITLAEAPPPQEDG